MPRYETKSPHHPNCQNYNGSVLIKKFAKSAIKFYSNFINITVILTNQGLLRYLLLKSQE